MKAIERLYQYIEYKGYKPTNFEKEIGLSSGYLSVQKKRNADIGETVVNKINDYCQDVNLEWLLTGKGSMLKDSDRPVTERKLIPFYDVNAEAGTMLVSNMDPVTEPAEYVDAGDWFLDADSAMRVHGDSMFPEYKSGSIVAMREVFNKHLVVYGEDYVIQTSEYKVIKRLMQSDREDCWLACSINNDTWETGKLAGRLIYEPFEICINDVTKIFRVLGCVKRTESSRIVYNQSKKI